MSWQSEPLSPTGSKPLPGDKGLCAAHEPAHLHGCLAPVPLLPPQLIKDLRTEGAAWVGRYASGGAVRIESGRKVYIAIDSVQGHLASNGWVAQGKRWPIQTMVVSFERGE